MIHGIGADLVRVARIGRNIERYGERFAARILAPEELVEFRHTARPAHFLAKRFAAKEAAAKAMGTGFRDGIAYRQIRVVHDDYGKPLLAFTGAARAFLAQHGIVDVHLSVSDEHEHALAFVTMGKRD